MSAAGHRQHTQRGSYRGGGKRNYSGRTRHHGHNSSGDAWDHDASLNAGGQDNKRRRQDHTATQHKKRLRGGAGADADGDDLRTAGLAVLKKKLRDTQRLLRRQDKLNAEARREAERRAKALESEIKDRELGEKQKTMVQKYKMVMFFERQKTVRKLHKLVKQLNEDLSASQRVKAEKEFEEMRHNLNYIEHYPKLEKYISLYKDADSKAAESTLAKRQQIMADVVENLQKGNITDAWEAERNSKAFTKGGSAERIVSEASASTSEKTSVSSDESDAEDDDDDESSEAESD